mmetsp:Transcript_50978/g.147105  ORF Transcript_50978/g.147105 Transcript_50978/m.147105 type:complete len:204 (+) Transcript_50978:259-870(+)
MARIVPPVVGEGNEALRGHEVPLHRLRRHRRRDLGRLRGRKERLLPSRPRREVRGLGRRPSSRVQGWCRPRLLQAAVVLRGFVQLRPAGLAEAIHVRARRHLPGKEHLLLLRDVRREGHVEQGVAAGRHRRLSVHRVRQHPRDHGHQGRGTRRQGHERDVSGGARRLVQGLGPRRAPHVPRRECSRLVPPALVLRGSLLLRLV